eukprot:925164-Amorphochlora_amoeboformis.AAC.1
MRAHTHEGCNAPKSVCLVQFFGQCCVFVGIGVGEHYNTNDFVVLHEEVTVSLERVNGEAAEKERLRS